MYTPTPINLLTAPIHKVEPTPQTAKLSTPQVVKQTTPQTAKQTTPQPTGNTSTPKTLLDGDKVSVVNAISSNTGNSTHSTPQNPDTYLSLSAKADRVPTSLDAQKTRKTQNQHNAGVSNDQLKNVLPISRTHKADAIVTIKSAPTCSNNHIICDSDNELNPASPSGTPEKVTRKSSSDQSSLMKAENVQQEAANIVQQAENSVRPSSGNRRLIPELTPKQRAGPDPAFLKMEDVQKLLSGQTRLHSNQQQSPVTPQQGTIKATYVPGNQQTVSTADSPYMVKKVIVPSQKVALGSEASRELLEKLWSPTGTNSSVKTVKLVSPSTPVSTPSQSSLSKVKSEVSPVGTTTPTVPKGTPAKITLGSAKNAELLQKLLPSSSRSYSPLPKQDIHSSGLKTSSASGNVSIVPQYAAGKEF